MRFFLLDKYHTWYDWRLTLTAKEITPPEAKTNYVELDGAHGTLDLTEALTGEPAYSDRTISASFWSSEGTFRQRRDMMKAITAALHGKKVKIVEPDDLDHYYLGRVKIKAQEQDMVHIAFDIEAICDPWRYAMEETVRRVAVDGAVDVILNNNGVKTLCPVIAVEGSITLTFDGASVELTSGSYEVSTLQLRQGMNLVSLSGSGVVTFTYREAGL